MPVTLELKVVPNSSRDEVAGWVGEKLKVKLRAPAVDGRANHALGEFLAERLGVPRRAVSLVRGETSRNKLVRVEGLSADEVRVRLSTAR